MRRDVLLYLSGPISPKNGFSIETNVASALRVFLECLKLGIPAFCPHLSAIFPSSHLEITYATWMDYDYAIIDRCTDVLMLAGWQNSFGAQKEMAYAQRHNKPIFYSLDDFAQQWPAPQPEDEATEHIK